MWEFLLGIVFVFFAIASVAVCMYIALWAINKIYDLYIDLKDRIKL